MEDSEKIMFPFSFRIKTLKKIQVEGGLFGKGGDLRKGTGSVEGGRR
jgi:hypothetical protein